MRRHLCLALLLSMAAGGALADEPGLCKSMCASDQGACRKDAVKLTALDKEVFSQPEEKNPMARTASQAQFASAPARVAQADDFRRRRGERTGQCDTAFQRCVRACAVPAGTSEVLTKQGQAKRGGAAVP